MSEGSEPVVVEVAVASPVEVVWRSLREPELIKRWHGWHYDDLDAEVHAIYLEDVRAAEPTHTLQLSDGDRFELSEGDDGGTVVRLVRTPYVEGAEWSAYYAEITEGWLSFLQQLKFMHEVQGGAARRTIFLSGTGDPTTPSQLLSSVPVAVSEPRYVAEHQQGLELPDLGPGLLILAVKPSSTGDFEGALAEAMAIVTTYGQDEAQFASTTRTWVDWWRSGYLDADEPQV